MFLVVKFTQFIFVHHKIYDRNNKVITTFSTHSIVHALKENNLIYFSVCRTTNIRRIAISMYARICQEAIRI